MKAVEKRPKIWEDNPEKLWVNMLTDHTYGWSAFGLTTFWMQGFGAHPSI